MTRKDFNAIAFALAKVQPETRDSDTFPDSPWRVWAATRDSVAEALAESNPRFNKARFREACEMAVVDDTEPKPRCETPRHYYEALSKTCECGRFKRFGDLT